MKNSTCSVWNVDAAGLARIRKNSLWLHGVKELIQTIHFQSQEQRGQSCLVSDIPKRMGTKKLNDIALSLFTIPMTNTERELLDNIEQLLNEVHALEFQLLKLKIKAKKKR